MQEGIRLSAYALPGEEAEDVCASLTEMSLLELAPRHVFWPERQIPTVSKDPGRTELRGLGEGRPSVPFGFKTGQQFVLASTIVCLISCIVSYFIFSQTQKHQHPF